LLWKGFQKYIYQPDAQYLSRISTFVAFEKPRIDNGHVQRIGAMKTISREKSAEVLNIPSVSDESACQINHQGQIYLGNEWGSRVWEIQLGKKNNEVMSGGGGEM